MPPTITSNDQIPPVAVPGEKNHFKIPLIIGALMVTVIILALIISESFHLDEFESTALGGISILSILVLAVIGIYFYSRKQSEIGKWKFSKVVIVLIRSIEIMCLPFILLFSFNSIIGSLENPLALMTLPYVIGPVLVFLAVCEIIVWLIKIRSYVLLVAFILIVLLTISAYIYYQIPQQTVNGSTSQTTP